ncbi:MAG TPA: SDR family oxidoreductase [Actinomycetota bacterium]|nr:SDR family oxidoreductase [Actinomycetota bacterium]
MADGGSVVIVGGTSGLGLELARSYADEGWPVVLSGRDPERARVVAKEVGGATTGIGFDLTRPKDIAPALADVGEVRYLVLAAIDRDENSVRSYDVDRALHLVTLKQVGYTEVVHALADRIRADGSILLFGGRAKDRIYPGSTTVTTVNAAIAGMVRAFAVELAPIRVNSIHPGIVGDSPYWRAKPEAVLEAYRSQTTTGRLPTMADIVQGARFLLENPAACGIDLHLDGGWLFHLGGAAKR